MRILIGNWGAIYRRELQSYMTSPFYWAIAGLFWLISGLFFASFLQTLLVRVAELDLQAAATGGVSPVNLPYVFQQNYLGVLGFLMLILMPMFSMGLYAEERKRRTLELLATSPVTNWAVAIAKLLAVVTFVLGLLLPLMLIEAVLFSTADPPLQPAAFLLGWIGLLLLAATLLSLGMFISALTDSTLLAAVFSFALALLLWALDSLGGQDWFSNLSLLRQFSRWVQGEFDSSSLVLLLSLIGFGVFLTAQAIQTFRVQQS
jgi:ABC-2 type transport system permease protein